MMTRTKIRQLVTTLPRPEMGRNGNLEGVAKRFVSSFLQAVPTSLTMFRGRDMGRREL